MAINAVVFADVSSLSVGSSAVEGANSFQASRSADNKPIYAFGSALPVVTTSSRALGTGSFGFPASDGTLSSGTINWATQITGNTTITVSGGMYPSGTTQTLTFTGCQFAGQSGGLQAKNEMSIQVNFTFISGTF